jgi:hypothetical protein
MLVTAIVIGRTLGWVSMGHVGGDVPEMVVELTLIASLLALARDPRGGSTPVSNRRTRLAMASLVLLPAAALALFLVPSVQERIYAAGAARRTSTVNTAPLEQDALRVAVCGSSAPLPSPSRAKSCVAVFVGGRFYVVDAGPESVENLVLWGIPLSSISGVLLTHFHSDHIGDLGELNLQTWAGGRPGPLHVWGGPGVDRVVAGFSEAYRLDQGYRTAHHGERVMPSATWPMVAHTVDMDVGSEIGQTAVVLDQDGLRITAGGGGPLAHQTCLRLPLRLPRPLGVHHRRSEVPPVTGRRSQRCGSASLGGDCSFDDARAGQRREGGRPRGNRGRYARHRGYTTSRRSRPPTPPTRRTRSCWRSTTCCRRPTTDSRAASLGTAWTNVARVDWTIADDGSLYTMPIGSTDVRIGRVAE